MAKSMKELNARVEELAEEFREGLSKFSSQLSDLNLTSDTPKSTETFIMKFKEFEKAMHSSLEAIRKDVSIIGNKLEIVKKECDNSAMVHNSKFIIIHGIAENDVDLYENVINVCKHKISCNTKKSDISCCYRMGKKYDNSKKPRPVAVEFCQRWFRDYIYSNKKKLKGTNILFTEKLTQINLKLFNELKKIKGRSCWSTGGRIYFTENNIKMEVRSDDDIIKLKNSVV